jgi:hypothetical protein
MAKLRDADRQVYPHISNYIEAEIPLVPGNTAVWTAFLESSGMDEFTARDAITGGIKSPQILFIPLTPEFGRFRTEWPEQIELGKEMGERFEQDYRNFAAQKTVEATLLTQLVAWRRAKSDPVTWASAAANFFNKVYGGEATLKSLWPEIRPEAASASARNAILFEYAPIGASAETAAQDKLASGVGASRTMAETDEKRVLAYRERFNVAAFKYQLPPALLAGIASRESRGGPALVGGWDRAHRAFGIMQIEASSHSIQGQPDPASQEHIDQAASILSNFYKNMQMKFAYAPRARQLQAAVACYNFGEKNSQTIENLDHGTHGNDYSNDVWTRALYYASVWG